MSRRIFQALLLILALAVVSYLVLIAVIRPSNDRHWTADQERLPSAVFAGESVQIKNVRNARYRSTSDFDVRWEERRYDMGKLESVWFAVEPFSHWRGPAHTFLSFGFGNGEYIAISVEIRKEQGESFSPLSGVLRQYELTYVVGDERDLIGLRANHRHDDVYLYKVRTTPEKMRALFVSMLNRIGKWGQTPLLVNCFHPCRANTQKKNTTAINTEIRASCRVTSYTFLSERINGV